MFHRHADTTAMAKEKKKQRKQKRKLTKQEKRARDQRRKEYMTIFIKGKQKRVKREPTIEGMSVDEFIRINADPIWLLQNEDYELLHEIYEQEFPPYFEEKTPDTPTEIKPQFPKERQTPRSSESDIIDDNIPF